MDLININEFDMSYNPFLQTSFALIDFNKTVTELNEKHKKIREQQPNGPIYSMRSEAKRLKSLLSLDPMSTWSPNELASAGFFSTGVENSCQCFCCGLVFCNQSLSITPIEKHKKFNPDCAFIQGIDVGNISKYDIRPQSIEISPSDHRMQDEQARLQTFSCWPPYTLMEPDVLAQAGFFFTGTRDHVQCFSCGGCLGNWEENDDPWKEHAKWFPECKFLQGKKTSDEIQQYSGNYSGFRGIMGTSFKHILNNEIGPELSSETSSRLSSLTKHLIERYHDRSFQHVSPFGDTITVDLDSQFADICVMLKDKKNQAVRQLILPDILSELNDITMIEGEANSGKTALLRKIAILWASGSCPILSRFGLVFYISLASTESHQTLSDIICQQLIGPSTSLTEESLGEITGKLKDKVLFLLDDYGVQDSTPKPVEELILKNPWNRLNLAVTVSTDKGRKLRQYARTIMSIQKFPLYSSIYLAKKLFPHDIERVRAFFAKLETCKNLAAVFEIPLIILLQCSFWIRYPSDNTVGGINIFKEYVEYNISKFFNVTETANFVVSSCGDLALKGLFQSQFQFTENDLRAAGVDGDRAIKYGLLSKFTAQRLQSTYRFYSTTFQEFLSGKRLCELLESENPEDLEKGLHYLHQVNTFLKIIGRYRYFLNYATRISTKATLKIFSYLFSLYDKPEALDCHLDSTEHLQRHPDLEIDEKFFIMAVCKFINTDISSTCMNLLMASAIEAAVENQCLPDCAPIILQFMAGKTMSFSVSPFSKGSSMSILYFIEKYPKCITLLSGVKFTFNNPKMEPITFDFSGYLRAHEPYGVPTVDEDYSSAYLSLNNQMQENEKKLNESNEVFSLFPEEIQIDDSLIRPFTAGHKVPLFIMEANRINSETFSQSNSEKIQILFLMSDRIEMHLTDCKGFVKSIGSAINQFSGSFKKIVIHNTSLEEEEQDIILKMTSLESLEIRSEKTNYPELLVRGIHKFTCLEEISIVLPNNTEITDSLSDEFHTLTRMKKIVLQSSDSTRFVNNIQSFEDLEVLHLHFKKLQHCNDLINSLTTCRNLKDLDLHDTQLQESDMALLASAMRNFTSLTILNLRRQNITAIDVSESFAMALGSLCHLEKLVLPVGDGMAHAAKLVIKQLCNLPNLQFLNIMEILDDESIALLAEEAKNGNFKKLRELELLMNLNITESGWTTFFEEAEQMPELYLLDISRMYTQQIKSHATTVKSFVRLVSRLPSLVSVKMYGWLLDEDDLNMFNAMKQNHPQSKSLNIYRQWFLPFSPNIEQ
ncbi:baculoviral IAP repeat-containing protein 1-like [Engystomops pustulosus]|uniref:baculoviral IAP repeat-containing protein 1-like n=1 Tax=Engystomops pustulosus TaxID=76066 RepID=UPI003AFB12B7